MFFAGEKISRYAKRVNCCNTIGFLTPGLAWGKFSATESQMPSAVTKHTHQQGFRSTLPRTAVMHCLASQTEPVSARSIFADIRHRGIDRSSIFRTLKLLSQHGLVVKTESARHEQLYELTPHRHHHHLHCERCGRIKSVSCFLPRTLMIEIRKRAGFAAVHDTGDLYGICRSCNKTKNTLP